MRIEGLSASAFQNYSGCEFSYFLQYGLGFESTAGSAALCGTISHKVLEILSKASILKHRKDSKIWDVEYLWHIVYNRYQNEEPQIAETIQDDKLRKICKGMHELIAGPYSPIRDNTISAEAGFNIPLIDPSFKTSEGKYLTLRGRIDRVDKLSDDTVEVVDYKSGQRTKFSSENRSKIEPADLYEEIQPRLYHLAAKELYPWAKHILVTFIYFTDGGPITVPFSDEDIKDTKNMVLRRFRAIKSNEDPQRNITWKCKRMCSFGMSGLCDEIWKESRELGVPFVQNKYVVLNTRRRHK